MGIINKLPQQLADMIAAGEVVERPSSVVKELFENAADAGAGVITVEIKGGGLTYISVSDNGTGISSDDVEGAFLRHATSKISSETDLEAILTLGFRGEALAAISSVSRVELLTRVADEDEGTRICLEGGVVVSQDTAARAVGTTITVRDLFFNTPARQKFVKSDRAEAAAISSAVARLALSRPDIAVRYVRDGAEELRTSGDGRTDSCIYAVLGREFSAGMLEVSSENEGIIAGGYVSKASALRGNRNQQFFFVNGRCVKSKTLQAALEQAYRNRMFTGRFPACVLYIEAGAGRLDVNVHPAKTEIKFLFEKHVFDAVYYGVLAALDNEEPPHLTVGTAPEPKLKPPSPPPQFTAAVRFPVTPEANATAVPRAAPSIPQEAFLRWDAPAEPVNPPQPSTPAFTSEIASAYAAVHSGAEVSAEPVLKSAAAVNYETSQQSLQPDKAVEEQTNLFKAPEFRVIGEALGTYVVVEAEGSLWLIDKHAAHERIHFDRLKSGEYDPMPQMLMEPVIVNPGGDGAEVLLENTELLARLGFEVEDFGNGKVAVRQIPTAIEPGDAEATITELCTELGRGGDTERRLDETYASVACKAAIKAGRSTEITELYELAARVMSGEVRFCPHGRPVAVELTKPFLDKSFKRL